MAGEQTKDDEIEVVIAGEEGANTSASGGTPGGPDLSPEEGIEQLQAKLRASEAARVEAENRARQATAVAGEEARRADKSDLEVIKGAISSIQQNNNVLMANKRALMAQGKWDAVCEIDLKVAENASKLQRLEEGRQALEPTVQEGQTRQQPQRSIDPIEQYVAPLSPSAAAWIRSHPEYVLDPNKRQAMERAHYAALGEGHAADTEDYFNFVNQKLNTGGAAQAQQPQTEVSVLSDASRPKTQRSAPPPAAPVTRGDGGSRQRVTLTGEEIEAARSSGLTPEEYWKNKQLLKKEGKLTAH